jgi:alcohol dehydrogenase class IV
VGVGAFRVGRQPAIVFGAGSRARIPEIAAAYGRRLLLVTGARSHAASRHGAALADAMGERKLAWVTVRVQGEPSPDLVDAAVREHRTAAIDAVVGIGGGSALDAAKAIAGLLRSGRPVLDHLEDVGNGVPYEGPAVPLIAVPTTAGTGSEATRNAVLSSRGPGGFKKSFRDDRLVARVAVVDPDLLETCPPALIAADGMDALTQLLEAFTSRRASPYTDALCVSGLAAVRDGLLPWFTGDGDPAASRERMAYAALLSGITLAQAGLGAVHGLAQPIGAYFEAPHGAVCGALLAAATAANARALAARDPEGVGLGKYARALAILAAGSAPAVKPRRRRSAATQLARLLEEWTERLAVPCLSAWGIGRDDVPRIVAGARNNSMKSNPVELNDDELKGVLGTATIYHP